MASSHYAAVAGHYASAMFYAEGPFKQWQVGCLLEAMGPLERQHRLADVGGGNGSFATSLARAGGLESSAVTLVEPSASMVASGGQFAGRVVCSDAWTWASSSTDTSEDQRHEVVLLKEVVHHMKDREECFAAMRRAKLASSGKLVIATRPRVPDYPLFGAALEAWAEDQPDQATLESELRAAGFTRVRTSTEAYPCSVSRDQWCDMIRSRFWSTFSKFSDVEIERGAEEIRHKFAEQILRFEERLVIIVADCPSSNAAWPLETRLAADGFCGPTEVLSTARAAELLESLDEYGRPAEALAGNDRFKLHLLLPELADLVRQPELASAARRLLGTPDVLVWSTDLVCKAPRSRGHFTPHQDSAYAGIAPPDACVTAWLALTDAREDNGCLRFWPRSHLRGRLRHVVGSDHTDDNMLAYAQFIPEYLNDLASSIPLPLRAGECSWHLMPTVHWSPPNDTDDRRVGFAIRYIAASAARSRGSRRESATLVAGDYDPKEGAFDLEPAPSRVAGPSERAAHADAMAREAANYFGSDEAARYT